MIENLEQIKEKIDIVDVVSHFIPLRGRVPTLEACCPFHEEKTPSFKVNTTRQMWRCFGGCDEGGDAISFVMKYKGVDFMEAVEIIAGILNIDVVRGQNKNFKKNDDAQKLQEICDIWKKNVNKIMPYLEKRGVNQMSVERFELGLGTFTQASDELKEKYTLNAMNQRLTFPIKNKYNKIIGFGGRKLSGNGAKYINSKTNTSFNKSNTFYGLNIASRYIARRKEAIVVEGYMDVIMAHQAGFKTTLGVLGTALTKEHLAVLNKMGAKIGLFFDKDEAGKKAMLRSMELLVRNGFYDAFILDINTKQKDFADIVLHDPNALQGARKIPIIEYFMQKTLMGFEDLSVHEKNKKINYILNFLSLCANDFLRTSYIKQLESYGYTTQKTTNYTPRKPKITLKIDVLEAQIIQACYKNKENTSFFLHFLSTNDFRTSKDALQAIVRGETNTALENILMLDLPKLTDIKQAVKSINERKERLKYKRGFR